MRLMLIYIYFNMCKFGYNLLISRIEKTLSHNLIYIIFK